MTIAAADVRRGALDAIDRWVNVEPTAEGVLQRTADLLVERFDRFAAVSVLRPGLPPVAAGRPAGAGTASFPIRSGGEIVGELRVETRGARPDGEERAFLEHVARMVSSRCGA